MEYSSLNKFPYIVSSSIDSTIIRVFVQPNAKKSEYCGIHGDALRIRIQAQAIDNKANIALLSFLVELFCIKKKEIKLIAGESSRYKQVEIYKNPEYIYALCMGVLL